MRTAIIFFGVMIILLGCSLALGQSSGDGLVKGLAARTEAVARSRKVRVCYCEWLLESRRLCLL